MKSELEIFVENMKRIRKAKGYSQAKLAELSCLSTGLIGELENKNSNPNINTLSSISKALEVSLSNMFQDPLDVSTRVLTRNEKIEMINDLLVQIKD